MAIKDGDKKNKLEGQKEDGWLVSACGCSGNSEVA